MADPFAHPSAADLPLPCGTPLFMPIGGEIETLIYAPGRRPYPGGGYGTHVVVRAGSYRVMFGHMSGVSSKLTQGQSITPGTFLGRSGNTGHTIGVSGCHLHLGVAAGNKPFNARGWLSQFGSVTKGSDIQPISTGDGKAVPIGSKPATTTARRNPECGGLFGSAKCAFTFYLPNYLLVAAGGLLILVSLTMIMASIGFAPVETAARFVPGPAKRYARNVAERRRIARETGSGGRVRTHEDETSFYRSIGEETRA